MTSPSLTTAIARPGTLKSLSDFSMTVSKPSSDLVMTAIGSDARASVGGPAAHAGDEARRMSPKKIGNARAGRRGAGDGDRQVMRGSSIVGYTGPDRIIPGPGGR